MTPRRRVVFSGTAEELMQLADLIEAGEISGLRSDAHAPIGARGDLIEDLREAADSCGFSYVKTHRTFAPVELITVNEWCRGVADGGQGVSRETARRWAANGWLPVFIVNGKRYVRADQKPPADLRRQRNGRNG